MAMLRILAFLIACVVSNFIFAQSIKVDFEGFASNEAFTQASWQKKGFTVPWVDGFDQGRAYVDSSFTHFGKRSLKISYPKGGFGPSETGAQAPHMVPAADQYFTSYWLRFGDDFSWGTTSYGGKLPGLGSGDNCSGCTTCTGTNGFSARLMWRTGGRGVLYLYNMDKIESCGDDYQLKNSDNTDFYFHKGQWHQVVERVKVNTASNHDGEVELWMDGQHALLVTGLQFVNDGSKVDNLYFSTFHGGSTADWAPVNDCDVWFDDIVVSTQVTDVFPPLGISENDLSSKVDLLPQPVQGGQFLSIKGVEDDTRVEIVDSFGKTVDAVSLLRGRILVPRLPSGYYFIRIKLRGRNVVKRMLVE